MSAEYIHPGYKKPYPIITVLRDLASQEGCDGEPYDAMMFAAKNIEDLEKGLLHSLASLATAISLLERTPKANKASPSDKMFDQMILDYKKELEDGRKLLGAGNEQ